MSDWPDREENRVITLEAGDAALREACERTLEELEPRRKEPYRDSPGAPR